MYLFIYILVYLFSLLPWRLLYIISDIIALLLQHVLKYRVKVVAQNLAIAFPQKTAKERQKIANEFYQQFTDSFIETFKLISISDKNFDKRFTSNVEVLNKLYATGQSVQIMAGHFFNWEFANWGVAKFGKYPFIAVYMPLSNPYFNKIILKLRMRFGSIMIPATNFKTQFHKYATQGIYAMALAADQNPGNPLSAYWVPFFGRLTPFVKGPEKGALLNNTAQVFVHFYRVKRGYYHSEYEVMTTSPNYFKDGQLTALYVKILEEKIKAKPANYLWSHRRWRYEYDAKQHEKLVVH
ncbi:MAG: lipid A biosynthesis acyltransferase [Chitinophagia bacterium]|jgi:KDO2-lipid IV(A) lauroyltransferase|nr:lipid A biosynthesis acyltransferase [Chitinophagia bacterium]NCA29195.1 lipid A biosynthesis acyltransferase [Chitinophagia bacterium]